MILPGGILTSRDPSSDLGYCRKFVSFLTPAENLAVSHRPAFSPGNPYQVG